MVFNDSSLSPSVNKYYYAYLVIRINFLLILIHAKKLKVLNRRKRWFYFIGGILGFEFTKAAEYDRMLSIWTKYKCVE